MGKAGIVLKAAKMLKAAKKGAREGSRSLTWRAADFRSTGADMVRSRRTIAEFPSSKHDVLSKETGAMMNKAHRAMTQLKKMFPKEYRAIKEYGRVEAGPEAGLMSLSKKVGATNQGYSAALNILKSLGVNQKESLKETFKILENARILSRRNLMPAGALAASSRTKKEK